ncbi:ADP-glyceromanno-heptose 6-epimerase [Trichlorobacter ammonificans]|uniref:ADP-L-glycero-D-manno-heptose-6-epimerase n=1 Tax=Trichlorobacter ammonificans TaxID=2916410 RepID=A0ABM9D5F8_9BACT|nr:ADP-glyceromanno-heptose 6-epimerase [Trichlorobacter ammonificans]CAH2029959.1 ADP-L-glycero-D-manno-heptose-6-epimerase [Trichlorobacter ammonificans]
MIIVTGGAGLIGSAVVHGLNRRGCENILVVDHLGMTEKWRNLVPLKFRDYLEKDAFETLLDNGGLPARLGAPLEAVIHLGACSATTERDATYLIRNNFEYSRKLALVAREQGARFIYASSAATYGNGELGFSDDETKLASLRPMNMYGYSKQLFDLWLQREGMLGSVVGLKYYNVFGPNERHKGEMRSLVQKAFEQISATGALKLFKSHRPDYADGEQVRDFVYVKDAAAMTLHFLDNREAGGIFNVGGGSAASWNRLGAAVFAAMELPSRIEYIDMPPEIRDTYQYRTCAETGKIRATGYTADLWSLEAAVSDYIRNYLIPNRHLGDEG